MVAREGNLTRAAERLNLSQSALSTQIRALEERLGHALFDRVGRKLVLTEVGQIVLDYADRIFGIGEELLDTIARTKAGMAPLRVGALSTLSRNFQLRFLRPVLASAQCGIVLTSGDADSLYRRLASLALDVVLTTSPPPNSDGQAFIGHRIAEQPVQIHGVPDRLRHPSLSELLANEPCILPSEIGIRTGFESLVSRLGIAPSIVALVDDMAMVRLLARDGVGLAIAPSVVLADEIAAGLLVTAPFELAIVESFYAVTVRRNFPHPALEALLMHDDD